MIQWRLSEVLPVADGIKEVAGGVLAADSRQNKEARKKRVEFCC
jgi:hypothetical protein